MKQRVVLVFATLLIATSAFASWYDDYDAGLTAVRKGQWQVVIQKMSAAIAGYGNENNNARTYGNIFINYHPYYYRGLAYLRTGQYDKAISDLEKTQGPGEVDRGSIDELMQDAKSKQAAASTPEPQPQPPAPQPQPRPVPVPQPPAMDPALRQQVMTAINAANQSLAAARGRNAGATNEYRSAMTALADANSKIATAKNNDDLQGALAEANNAKLFADSAVVAAPPVVTPPTQTIAQPPSRPTVATGAVLGDTVKRVHQALISYFNGDFDEAATRFGRLSQEMPTNGWIWAFLGASQYSQYAFEADETYRDAALKSFKKAKQYHSWKGGLPPKYFSRRIRAAFAQS
ncbi:MAG TPA: tetratricopeptide repeat protein [Thermoanaerobaculia bacterium]|nr:tetratricopeptide repeat protein [Thermoanaerobaculia bacterium]